MKKYEILYDWPYSEITRLSDSSQAEEFAANLTGDRLDTFTRLTERMRGLGADLTRAKADRTDFDKWRELETCLEEFEAQFAAFPDLALRKFRFFVLLSQKLAEASPDLDSDPIDENLFEIRELLTQIPLAWFSKENARSFVDSLVIFGAGDLAAVQTELDSSTISPTLLFHLLAALHSLPDVPTTRAVLVKKAAPSIDATAIDAFARLIVLASGKAVHCSREYLDSPAIIDRDGMLAGSLYQQWNDVFDVFSEYNSRKEILTKYLTLYHVIENLMFKLPIVELETQKSGRMFSIRDFRRLYGQIESSEMAALRKLFQEALQLEITPGITFKDRVLDRWNALVPATSAADLDNALLTLDLSKKRPLRHSEFSEDISGNLSKLVYAIRNAIVHNKETEFHLTFATLSVPLSLVIESFMIPSLEEISFALVGNPNTCVWYSNREILLYE